MPDNDDMSESSPELTSLEARVHELEAENARLAAPSAGGRWRAFASAACIVIATILVPVSIAGAWARVQLVDEDSFVRTLAPLADHPEVQALVIDETMSAIQAQLDFAEITGAVVDGVRELGVGPHASAALGLLQQPLADGLAALTEGAVTTVVESEAFADVWATAVRGAHRAFTIASTSDGRGIVVLSSDGVGIQFAPIVEQVKEHLVDRGVGVGSLIPTVDHTVVIAGGEALTAIRTSYAVAATIGWWLPVVTLALLGLGIALARRRESAVLGSGVGLAIGGAALAIALSIGATAVSMAAVQLNLSPSALDVIYRQLVADMSHTVWVIALIGVFVALVGWLMGRSASARRLRAGTESLNASARRSLAARGLDTGAFGAWLDRNRTLVRVLIAVLAVLWLFALRPMGAGDVVLVVVVTVVTGWAFELLRLDDQPATATDEAPAEASAPAP